MKVLFLLSLIFVFFSSIAIQACRGPIDEEALRYLALFAQEQGKKAVEQRHIANQQNKEEQERTKSPIPERNAPPPESPKTKE